MEDKKLFFSLMGNRRYKIIKMPNKLVSEMSNSRVGAADAPRNFERLLIVQRVLTPYRYELLCRLAENFHSVEFVTAKGESAGAYRLAKFDDHNVAENISIAKLASLKIAYSGESRGFPLFFYPQVIFKIWKVDVLLLEGTTNLLNNILIIPVSKMLGKKVVWWDAGYSLQQRTKKRKLIDFVVRHLVRMTDAQIAYSSKARNYMMKYMGAENCFTVLNTIATIYFENMHDEITRSVERHKLDRSNIKLLYVGAVEERKKVRELIDLVRNLNVDDCKYSLTIVGDGEYLSKCKAYVSEHSIQGVIFEGAIYDKNDLKNYYFDADLFVLPGDGGLGIAQSLLFGLPVVCVAADGTEIDYIDDPRYVLDDFDQLHEFLTKFLSIYNRSDALRFSGKLLEKNFVKNLVKVLEE